MDRVVTRCRGAAIVGGVALLILPGVACRHHKRALIEDNKALLGHAEELIARRRLLEAVQVLGDAGLVNPVGEELDPQIKLALADAYFYQGGTVNIVEAQGRYEQFLNFYPLNPLAPYARYQVGACLFAQSENPNNDQEYSQRALDHFNAMIRELPEGSTWGLAAHVMAGRAQDKLAEHEWLVGNYYLQRGRYLGAIGRLSSLIETYPGSQRREEAFFRMADAYNALGDKEQARLTLRRLLADYPSGKLAAEAKDKLASLG